MIRQLTPAHVTSAQLTVLEKINPDGTETLNQRFLEQADMATSSFTAYFFTHAVLVG